MKLKKEIGYVAVFVVVFSFVIYLVILISMSINADSVGKTPLNINLAYKIQNERAWLDLYIMRTDALYPYPLRPEDLRKDSNYKILVDNQTLLVYEEELSRVNTIKLIEYTDDSGFHPQVPLLIYGEFIGDHGIIFSFGLSLGNDMLINGKRVKNDVVIYDLVKHFVPASETSNFRLKILELRFGKVLESLFSK